MTFSAVPFALQNSSHSADLFRQAVSSLVPPGGGRVTTGDLAVTQTGTPSMNVLIGVGRIWIPGTNVGNVVGGNFSSQAMYYGQNDSAYTASVATSDPVNPRIDVVYAAVQDSQYSGLLNAGVLSVASGAPTSGATYPANAPALPANSKALAWITVAANAASITNANITALDPTGVIDVLTSTAVAPPDGGWTILGGVTRTNAQGFKQCHATLKLTRVGAPAATINQTYNALLAATIPAAFRPITAVQGHAVMSTTAGAFRANLECLIGTNGDIAFRVESGSVTLAANDVFYVDVSWWQ
jgi:hypothetical protein